MIKYDIDADGKLIAIGDFPKSGLASLRESIRKWAFIAENVSRIETDNGTNTCALCQHYHNCFRCPVGRFTKTDICHKTPYVRFIKNRSEKNALAEMNFLKKLLALELEKGKKK